MLTKIKSVVENASLHHSGDYLSQTDVVVNELRNLYSGSWIAVMVPKIFISNTSRVSLDVYGQRLSLGLNKFCVNAF